MTVKETAAIMQILYVAFPAFYSKVSEDDKTNAVKLWANLFADDTPHEVAVAVKAYIATDTSGFPPTIGQIKERIANQRDPAPLPSDIWAEIRNAISNGKYHSREEYAKLSPIAQRLASPEQIERWALMPADTVDSVIASNIQSACKALIARQREENMLPDKLRDDITKIAETTFKRLTHEIP